MKMNTDELIGPALDWATGQALGAEIKDHTFGIEGSPTFMNCTVLPSGQAFSTFKPSSDWSTGGPLIVKHVKSINTAPGGTWTVEVRGKRPGDAIGTGPTPLVATMRALVLYHLGQEVNVPDSVIAKQD